MPQTSVNQNATPDPVKPPSVGTQIGQTIAEALTMLGEAMLTPTERSRRKAEELERTKAQADIEYKRKDTELRQKDIDLRTAQEDRLRQQGQRPVITEANPGSTIIQTDPTTGEKISSETVPAAPAKEEETVDLTDMSNLEGFESLKGIKVKKSVADDLVRSLTVEKQKAIDAKIQERRDEARRNFERDENQKDRDSREKAAGIRQSKTLTDKQFSQANTLRDDLKTEIKDYPTTVRAVNKMREAAAGTSPADSITVLYAFIQMQDNSVVREAEAKMGQSLAPIKDRVRNTYERLLRTGGVLAPDEKKYFVDAGESILRAVGPQYEETIENYREAAKRHGLDPEDVTLGIPSQSIVQGRGGAKGRDGSPAGTPPPGAKIIPYTPKRK